MISIVVVQGHGSQMVLAINASGHPRIRWVDVGQILYGINGKSLDENQTHLARLMIRLSCPLISDILRGLLKAHGANVFC
jgi:hypothetical protein